MIHKEYNWQLGGKKVFAQAWLPDNHPKALISLVHGLGEHSGRYKRWGEMFVDSGFALLAMDLFGNGLSGGKKGHIKTYDEYLDQVGIMLEKSTEQFPGTPMILYGHSMGGNIILNYSIFRDSSVSAVIASSTWLRLSFPISRMERISSRLANSILPGLRVKAKGVGAEALSHDPEHWEDLRSDPLMHRQVSIRCFYEIMAHGESALRQAQTISKPVLLMHGDADEITSCEASREFADNSNGKAQFKIWEGLRHELHSEFEYREVHNYILGWIGGLNL